MNVTRRLNQISNFLTNRKDHKVNDWVLVYGLPRSGTSYLLNKLMLDSRCGIGDWELPRIGELVSYYKNEEHIGLSTDDLVHNLRSNIFMNATPGGGIKYDLVVKQINLSPSGSEFLSKLFDCPPTHTFFCFREPNSWIPSAMKKFNIEKEEAIQLYRSNMESYKNIGGVAVEYSTMGANSALKKLKIDTSDFSPSSKSTDEAAELTEIYNRFKKSQSLD